MKTLLFWSSGKDSAWTLSLLRERRDVEVVGLLTTYHEALDRVAMHGVRMELVRRQAAEADLPLWEVPLPWPCSNEIYEQQMREVVERAQREKICHFAFGDLHLADIRRYRERQLSGTRITALFPLWGAASETSALAETMIQSGLRATLTCIDPTRMPSIFLGREFDANWMSDLPTNVDPCGECGEFHTFCHTGPMFRKSISVIPSTIETRDGFQFLDLLPS